MPWSYKVQSHKHGSEAMDNDKKKWITNPSTPMCFPLCYSPKEPSLNFNISKMAYESKIKIKAITEQSAGKREWPENVVLLLNLIDLRKWHEFSEQIKKPSKAKLKQSQITFNWLQIKNYFLKRLRAWTETPTNHDK